MKKEREQRKGRDFARAELGRGAVRKALEHRQGLQWPAGLRSLCLSRGHFPRELPTGNDLDTNPTPKLSCTQSSAGTLSPPSLPFLLPFPRDASPRAFQDVMPPPAPSAFNNSLSSSQPHHSTCPAAGAPNTEQMAAQKSLLEFASSNHPVSQFRAEEIGSVKSNSSWAVSLENGLCREPDINSLLRMLGLGGDQAVYTQALKIALRPKQLAISWPKITQLISGTIFHGFCQL